MTHYSPKEWEMFINNLLSESEVKQMEDHLYSCDVCLERYLTLIEKEKETLPHLQKDDLTADIINKVTSKPVHQKRDQTKQPVYKRTIFHYSVAALLTLCFMGSGLFHTMSSYMSTVEAEVIDKPRVSITENLMNKTIKFINEMEPIQKEGMRHE